jgi:hypothetical protein
MTIKVQEGAAMITKYCLKVKFAGVAHDLFFEVDEKEFSRLKERYLEVIRGEEAVSFTMSDGSAVIIACKNVETIHFVFESSLEEFPSLGAVKEEEVVVKYRLLGRQEPEYLTVDSPSTAVEFYDRIREALEKNFAEDAGLFFSVADEDGRDFYFNRDALLYIVVPKKVFDEGCRLLGRKR